MLLTEVSFTVTTSENKLLLRMSLQIQVQCKSNCRYHQYDVQEMSTGTDAVMSEVHEDILTLAQPTEACRLRRWRDEGLLSNCTEQLKVTINDGVCRYFSTSTPAKMLAS